MRKLAKKKSIDFTKAILKGLKELGAIQTDDFLYNFEINTIAGKLLLKVEEEQKYLYALFARFEEPEKAKQHFLCNPHSGKYNWFLSANVTGKEAAKIALSHIEFVINKK